MKKGSFISIPLACLFLFFLSGPYLSAGGAPDTLPESKEPVALKMFVFDGIKLTPAGSISELIKTPPVTGENYFALFFVLDEYVPVVKVIKAGRDTLKRDPVVPEIKLDRNKGYLTGVVYKPVHGGKIAKSTGMAYLWEGAEIRVVNGKSTVITLRSDKQGIFGIQLAPGSYSILTGGNTRGKKVSVRKGMTTIQNLQKGLTLRD